MKVYVTTSGEYSDFFINEIFTTEELAKQHVENGWADEYYEEEVLDHPVEYAEYYVWEWDLLTEEDEFSVHQVRKGEMPVRAVEHKVLQATINGKIVYVLRVKGWDYEGVKKTLSEQIAKAKCDIEWDQYPLLGQPRGTTLEGLRFRQNQLPSHDGK